MYVCIFKDTYIFKGCGVIYLKFSYHLTHLLINYQSNVQYKNQKGGNSGIGGKCFNFASKTLHDEIMNFYQHLYSYADMNENYNFFPMI